MAQTIGKMTHKKTLGGLVALLVISFAWHGFGMLGFGEPEPPPPPPPMSSPKPGTLPTAAQDVAASPQQADLYKMQQELQMSYISGLNQLQMLKLARDVAAANNELMTAKLNMVTSEKKIVDLLTQSSAPPPPPHAMAPSPSGEEAQASVKHAAAAAMSVISVSQLQQKWTAVISDGSTLYSLHIGDTLPTDGSKVVDIDKSGVILEKNGIQMKMSMVSVI